MKHRNFSWIMAVLLAAVMVLAGCGKKDISGTVTPAESPAETTATETESTEPESTEPEEKPLSLGRLEGNVYTNTYAGFGCTMDSSWTFYSAEELQDVPSTVKDAFSGSELGDAMADYDQITDMMAECVDDLTSINVLYQKMSMQERITYALLSEEEIADEVLEGYDLIADAYAQMGIDVTSMEKVSVTFLGEPHSALKTTATTQGVDYYILQVFDYQLGEYSVTTTFASYVEDKTESLLDLFYKVD